MLIKWGAASGVGLAIEMAAYASVASSLVMLLLGIALSRRVGEFVKHGIQWIATLALVFFSCWALSQQSYMALVGLGLFILLPQGLRAMKTIVDQPFEKMYVEAE